MSHRLKLLIGLVALSSLPALSACDTGRGAGPDAAALGQEGRGSDDVGEDSSPDEDLSRAGEEEQGTSGQAGDAAQRTPGGTGDASEGGLGEAGAGSTTQ